MESERSDGACRRTVFLMTVTVLQRRDDYTEYIDKNKTYSV